jgi:BMFP domain-containing protein YqiC
MGKSAILKKEKEEKLKKLAAQVLNKKFHLLCDLGAGIKIYADYNNFVLEIGNRNNRGYYADLESLFDDLLDYKLKINGIVNKKKTFEGLAEVIYQTREEIRQLLAPLREFTEGVQNGTEACRKGDKIS